MYTHGSRKGHCQAQPKPKSKLEAEMAIFSIVTTTHPPSHTAALALFQIKIFMMLEILVQPHSHSAALALFHNDDLHKD